jgi:hypothetical protein
LKQSTGSEPKELRFPARSLLSLVATAGDETNAYQLNHARTDSGALNLERERDA